MNNSEKLPFWRLDNPILWGILATSGIFLVGLSLSRIEKCSLLGEEPTVCFTKWHEFLLSSPNEVGDTLAGFAGALAFVWIIVTVWLQSHELAAQREELRLNREETAKMAMAQGQQVKLMQLQALLFEDEQKQRKEEYAGQESKVIFDQFHDLLLGIFSKAIEIRGEGVAPTTFRLSEQTKRSFSSGNQVLSLPTSLLQKLVLEALETVLTSDESRAQSFNSPEIEKVQVCLHDLNICLEKSNAATKRILEAQSLRSFETELSKYLGLPE